MTLTTGSVMALDHSSLWNLLFAQDPDKDLDFDEGLEDDDLNQSKPPSRGPILWIILAILAVGVAYWTLTPDSSFMSTPAPMGTTDVTTPGIGQNPPADVAVPDFQENQKVTLVAEAGNVTLMSDPVNNQPGPLVMSGETLVILDGSYQPSGWMYLVRTENGVTGWIAGDTLQQHL